MSNGSTYLSIHLPPPRVEPPTDSAKYTAADVRVEERSNKRKAPEEDRRTVENLVRSKERSRDVEREGSRDRDRASSRDRDRLRDNDRRSRDRGDRHNDRSRGYDRYDRDSRSRHRSRSQGVMTDTNHGTDERSAAALCITMMGVSSAGFAALFISSVTYKMYAEVISLMDCGYVVKIL
ncbi:hypothetical protein Tco_1092458 [Tanacetum coccineum]|uniref:Uncharacterized protein n=1 Tax=Tanacetum coccineum TaxID=301880 RepID=A0ABQ5IA94_9ASTR